MRCGVLSEERKDNASWPPEIFRASAEMASGEKMPASEQAGGQTSGRHGWLAGELVMHGQSHPTRRRQKNNLIKPIA
jgi:hypothetical protein